MQKEVNKRRKGREDERGKGEKGEERRMNGDRREWESETNRRRDER